MRPARPALLLVGALLLPAAFAQGTGPTHPDPGVRGPLDASEEIRERIIETSTGGTLQVNPVLQPGPSDLRSRDGNPGMTGVPGAIVSPDEFDRPEVIPPGTVAPGR